MPPRKTKTTKKTVKKDTSWQLTTIPLHSWVIFWALVLATMALATVCFTTAFRPAAEPAVDDEALAMFQAVKESLEQQVAELEGKVESTPKPSGRMIVTESTSDGLCEANMPLELSSESANQLIRFEHLATGVSAELPYNFDWGNAAFAAPPYEVTDRGILFGQVGLFNEGCWGRDATFEISNSSSSLSDVRRELANPPEGAEAIVSNIRERTINGIPVISYRMEGLGGLQNVWVGFGRNYQYRIYSHGQLSDAEAVKIIQSLRVTQ